MYPGERRPWRPYLRTHSPVPTPHAPSAVQAAVFALPPSASSAFAAVASPPGRLFQRMHSSSFDPLYGTQGVLKRRWGPRVWRIKAMAASGGGAGSFPMDWMLHCILMMLHNKRHINQSKIPSSESAARCARQGAQRSRGVVWWHIALHLTMRGYRHRRGTSGSSSGFGGGFSVSPRLSPRPSPRSGDDDLGFALSVSGTRKRGHQRKESRRLSAAATYGKMSVNGMNVNASPALSVASSSTTRTRRRECFLWWCARAVGKGMWLFTGALRPHLCEIFFFPFLVLVEQL